MRGKFLIYGLRDPRTSEIRYVGKSTSGLRRPKQHTAPLTLSEDRTHKGRWLRKLQRLGLKPEIVVLQEVLDVTDLAQAEKFWIAIGRAALGSRFTNLTEGGDGTLGWKPTEETKKNISANVKEAYKNPGSRARNSAAQKERYRDVRVREKIREIQNRPDVVEKKRARMKVAYARPDVIDRQRLASKLVHSDPETRQRHSAAAIEFHSRPEVKAKHKAAMQEIASRPEVKAKRSQSAIASFQDVVRKERHRAACKEAQNRPEVKQKMRERLTGRVFSPETRAKMSASAKLRGARMREQRRVWRISLVGFDRVGVDWRSSC